MATDPPPPAVEDVPTLDHPGLSRGPMPRVRVEFGGRTDPGKVRKNNEDHFLVAKLAKSLRVCQTSLPTDATDPARFSDEEGYLMVVADGMGGAAAGERASALAVATIEKFVLNTVKWFLHLGVTEQATLIEELRRGLDRADREVIARAQADPSLAGMGTTLTIAYSVSTDLFLVHAGDSRAYLFHDGQLQQLTTDHTLVQMLVDAGDLTREAARIHHRRNVVTNVIGGPGRGAYAEIHKLTVADGDVLLLCSDGLTEAVADAEVAAILSAESDPDAAAAALVRAALDRGGPDNVTVIVALYRIA